MKYEFPYEKMTEILIPDAISVDNYKPNEFKNNKLDSDAIIEESLDNPIHQQRLDDICDSSKNVLIIVDDISRPTPIHQIIPHVLERLKQIGINEEKISILIALGTHRAMNEKEICQKLGEQVASNYKVYNHEWNNPRELRDYGTLKDGTKVILNKRMHDADIVIGIGSITPHPAAGFTGGGKIITPGVATDEAAGTFHWNSVQVPQKEVLGVRDNPMRKMIDEISRMAGLDYIVNVILDGNKNIVGCVSGDPIEAHKRGAELSMKVFGVEIKNPNETTIFIVDTHPMDQDLWQAAKALCALDAFVPDNKIIILVSGAEEGVAPMHPEVLENGYQTLETVTPWIKNKKISKIVGHYLVQGGRLLKRTKPFLVTPTISSKDAKQLGFIEGYSQPQEALDAALKIAGKDVKVMIISSAGEICPIIK